MNFDSWVPSIWKAVYIPTCTICKKRIFHYQNVFCVECMGALPKTQFYQIKDNPVYTKLSLIGHISSANAFLYFKQDNMSHEILHQIKYNNNKSLGIEMGKLYGQDLINASMDADCIIPIPLHRSKYLSRGYNQSELISQGLATALKLKVDANVLIRSKNTMSQTTLNREQRIQNVSNVFEINPKKNIKNQSIILIDDVITTGATISEAIRVLWECEPKAIHVLTLACAFEL